jgi:hypothetical protein
LESGVLLPEEKNRPTQPKHRVDGGFSPGGRLIHLAITDNKDSPESLLLYRLKAEAGQRLLSGRHAAMTHLAFRAFEG